MVADPELLAAALIVTSLHRSLGGNLDNEAGRQAIASLAALVDEAMGLGPGDTTSIAERLRACRRRRGMTLDQLAAAAGISKTYLWELEADKDGVKRPSADVLSRLSRALGITLSDLMGLAEA